jgi:hypothetical protein
MGLALYRPRVRSNEVLGVTLEVLIEDPRDFAETHNFKRLLNGELEAYMQALALHLRSKKPQQCRDRFAGMDPFTARVLVLGVVEPLRETEVVIRAIPRRDGPLLAAFAGR